MALNTPSLQELASAISSQVSTITKFLQSYGLPQPSFAVGGSREREFRENLEIEQAYMELVESASDLLHLALGPKKYMTIIPLSLKQDQLTLEALNYYNVFDEVPLTGSITYAELAKRCRIPETRLRRFIQHAMSNRIFWAPTPNSVAHTITSAEVVRSPFLYAWLGHNVEEIGPGCTKVIEAMKQWGDSEDPTEAGFPLAFNLKGENLFQFFESDGVGEASAVNGKVDKFDRTKGWRARRFGNAMKFMMSHGVSASKHVHGGFDWESLGEATVVDCGGSTGHISLELASKQPKLTFIVQDFATLKPQFETTIPQDFKSRISFQTHDFLTPQPVQGAAVYFFKHIFHDWPDAICVKILQNIVPIMKRGSRIIIMDGVMPEVGQVPNFLLKINTSLDLQMMTAFNAKERRAQDWESLVKSADEMLVVKAIRQPLGSAASLIEVVLNS